jgi:thermitase
MTGMAEKNGFFLFLLFLFWIGNSAQAGYAEGVKQQASPYVENEVLVQFSGDVSSSRTDEIIQSVGAKSFSAIDGLDIYVLKVPKGSVEDSIRRLKKNPAVLFAEPNYYLSADDTIPGDPGFSNQYGLLNIRAPQGWDLSTGASWVTIAVIDSGVDYSHPDLAYKLLPGYDFVNGDSDPQDDNGHGTHVAGIAAAAANNGIGIAGVSWGAAVMPLKVLDSSGNGTYANAAAAIVWATDHGAQVINMSFGGSPYSATLENAVLYAYTRGVVQVAAAGNSGSGSVLYPARFGPVIAVAATDSANNRAGFSNYGPEVDLAAPGVSIYSLYPGGGYGYRSGTSMSAPFVSGLAAILIGIPGNYDAGFVESQMETTALDLGAPGWDVYYGAGLIQMDAAIRRAIPSTPTPTLATTTSHPQSPPILVSTWTASPLPPSPTSTLLPTPWPMPPPSFSSPTFTLTSVPSMLTPSANNAEGANASETPSPFPVPSSSMLWMPCLGIGLILLGLMLLALAIRLTRRPRRSWQI